MDIATHNKKYNRTALPGCDVKLSSSMNVLYSSGIPMAAQHTLERNILLTNGTIV